MQDLYKAISGKIYIRVKGVDLVVYGPSIDDKYLAEIFADEVYDEAFAEGYYTQEEMEELLRQHGWWSDEEEERLATLPTYIDQMKFDYFMNFHSEESREKVRHYLESTQQQIEELTGKKHLYFEHSCEGIRSAAFRDFLTQRTTFLRDGSPYQFKETSSRVVTLKVAQETLDSNQVRQLTKLDEWRALWHSCKSPHQIFGDITNMTTMQVGLVTWSQIYDSVYESMDTPSAAIIEDDLALDGWMVSQKRKREEEQKKQRGDKLADKLKNAGEILLPARTDDDVKRIYDMNTKEAKGKIKARFDELEERGSIEEQNFRVVRKDVAMAAQRMTAAALKGKR